MADRRATPGQRRHDAAQAELKAGGVGVWSGAAPEQRGNTRAAELVVGAGPKWGPALACVVGLGYGLTISSTRDGGAVALSLLSDEGPRKKYAAHPDELEALLNALTDELGSEV